MTPEVQIFLFGLVIGVTITFLLTIGLIWAFAKADEESND